MEEAGMRGFWNSCALLGGLIVAFLFAAASPSFAQSCQTYSGLTYATYVDAAGTTKELKLELLVPTSASGPVPVVVWTHGGGWRGGSRLPIPERLTALCARGYAVASVDYRLTTEALWPAQIQDCKGAVRWLRANAATYNLDPNRFGSWGDSAGGHLAAMLGVTGGLREVTIGNAVVDLEGTTGGNLGQSSRVQAAVDWYGATDSLQMRFYPSSTNHDSAVSDESRLIGAAIQNNPERVATTNPVSYVTPDDPPFLIMHGTVDILIPFDQSQLLVDALRANGVDVTFRPQQNLGHGGSVWNPVSISQPVYDFFDRVLGGTVANSVRVDATTATASEATLAPGTFTISRTGSTAAALTIPWVISGTAGAGSDHTRSSGSVTLAAGSASATVSVPPLDDSLVEGDETVVADDDSAAGLPVVTVTASDSLASETAGTGSGGAFTITRSGDTSGALTVSYQISGTATAGPDYSSLSGTVTIPAGQASAVVNVAPVDDTVFETSETVILTLSASADYALGAGTTASDARIASVAILDTEPAKPTVSLTNADPDAAEPSDPGAFFLWRTGSTTSPLTVSLVISGTAANGTDYSTVASTATFPAGSNQIAVSIAPVDDLTTENLETISLAVAPDPALFLGPRAVAVNLVDDDPPGTPELVSISLNPTSVVGSGTVTGTVQLSGPALSIGATVSLTSNDTSTATVPASITIPAGASSGTFTVTTYSVAAPKTVQITAARRGVTRTAALTVNEPSVQSLTLSIGNMAGSCQTSVGRVVLTAKAPAGGIVVPIANANAVAVMPATVTVPAGANAVNFNITAPAVTTTHTGTVTATYGGVSKSSTLTVRPIGVATLTLSPNPVVGPASVTGSVTLECAAAPGDVTVALTTTNASVAGPAQASFVIPAGATSGTFTVTTADVAAVVTANIRATSSNVGKTVTLTVNP
jgi:acetyl esterase/lipase